MQREVTNGKDGSNQYKSANTNRKKKVGEYKPAKVSRGNTSRRILIEKYWKIPIGKHKSENNNSEHTNRKIQLRKY